MSLHPQTQTNPTVPHKNRNVSKPEKLTLGSSGVTHLERVGFLQASHMDYLHHSEEVTKLCGSRLHWLYEDSGPSSFFFFLRGLSLLGPNSLNLDFPMSKMRAWLQALTFHPSCV